MKRVILAFRLFRKVTRFEQTLFALPFAVAGALLAYFFPSEKRGALWLWLPFAFCAARTSGMTFNQLIDRKIDALNPRTQNRPLPQGAITPRAAAWIAWSSLALFIAITSQVNRCLLLLSPLAVALLLIYSYMKRIHASCHLVLGGIHFLVPLMANVAFVGDVTLEACLLGGVAASSIIGTDILYAFQDYQFDKDQALFSLPSRLGLKKSLALARSVHLGMPLFLAALGLSIAAPLFYYLLIPIATAFLVPLHEKARHFLLGEAPHLAREMFIATVGVSFSTLLFLAASYSSRLLS